MLLVIFGAHAHTPPLATCPRTEDNGRAAVADDGGVAIGLRTTAAGFVCVLFIVLASATQDGARARTKCFLVAFTAYC